MANDRTETGVWIWPLDGAAQRLALGDLVMNGAHGCEIVAGRTAVTGWSHGGYMSAWLPGNHPDEWTVGMAGAPVTSWGDQYHFSDGSVTGRYPFGASPWTGDRQRVAREQSPITYAPRIRAPTLLMSHIEAFRVPRTQAMALYRALRDTGVETEFIAFPGRTHRPTDRVNARERTRLWVDWVKRHLDRAPRELP